MTEPAPPRPAPTDRTQRRTQKMGAYVALGVAVVFVAVVAYFIVSGGRGNGSGPPVKPSKEAQSPLGSGGGGSGELLPASGVRFDLTDKNDPTVRTGQIVFAAMDPLEGHRYAVEKPEAWLYLKSGRSLYVRGDSGLVYSPDKEKEPQSGTIKGHVEIRLFEAGVDVHSIDPLKTAPLIGFKSEMLAFDSAAAELSATDYFIVTWEGGTFEGSGLSLVFDQPKERLARGEVRQDGILKVAGTQKKKSPPAPPEKQDAPTSPETPAVATAPVATKIPVETLYRLIASGTVVGTQAQRELNADKLQVFARLIDNALPADAIREIRFVSGAKDAGAKGANANPALSTGAPAATAPGQVAVANGATAKTDGEKLVLSWKGPCVIVPLAAVPPELKDDHLAARFLADGSGQVTMKDAERGLNGHAAAIEYGATRGALSLVGAGPDVELAIPDSGRILATRLDTDLVKGIVTTPGAGSLQSSRAGGAKQDLSWTERGEFAFQTSELGLTGLLKEATMVGGVKGSGQGLTFSSQSARAMFAAATAGQKQALLSSVDLNGGAAAESGDTGKMRAGQIHVEFDPPGKEGGDVRPRFVRAEDTFTVERGGQKLAGNYLESKLIEVGEGKLDVGSVLARGGVTFSSDKDFVSGRTEELRADLGFDEEGKRKQLVDLIGADSLLKREEPGKQKGTVTGTQVHIDGVRNRLEVFGVGDFAYEGEAKNAMATMDAKWTRRMIYDGTAGIIDCWGDSLVHYSPDAATRNVADADRVKLTLTPGTSGRSLLGTGAFGSGGAERTDKPREEVRVLAAEAYGSILDREGGTNARIEARKYADGQEDVKELSYVEGPSILANNEKGTVDVPGAGKFLLMNRKQGETAPASAPGVRDLRGDSRGVSLFEWATSLHVEKVAGGETTMLMKDGVSVVHRALKDGMVTEIKCAEITAHLKDQQGSLGDSVGRGLELQSVLATGSVYAASGPPKTDKQPRPALREMIAERMEYDAIARRIEAKASPGSVVTMFDPAAASPTTAAWLVWDMEKDTVQVKQPAGVAPR